VRATNKIVIIYIKKICAGIAPSKKKKRTEVGNKLEILKQ
jgi:hypothetical protein